MPEMMRARHEVFGVNDVPDTDFYRDSGWVRVADDTPTVADDRRDAVNEARRGDLNEAPAPAVVAAMDSLPDAEREQVIAAEKVGKARKTVINAAE